MQELMQWMEETEFMVNKGFIDKVNECLEKEKQQIIDIMEKTAMYVSAASLDKEIGKMTFEDLYNQTYNQNK